MEVFHSEFVLSVCYSHMLWNCLSICNVLSFYVHLLFYVSKSFQIPPFVSIFFIFTPFSVTFTLFLSFSSLFRNFWGSFSLSFLQSDFLCNSSRWKSFNDLHHFYTTQRNYILQTKNNVPLQFIKKTTQWLQSRQPSGTSGVIVRAPGLLHLSDRSRQRERHFWCNSRHRVYSIFQPHVIGSFKPTVILGLAAW